MDCKRAGLVLLLCALAGNAQAHDFRDSRRLLLQVDAQTLLLVAAVNVPQGARAQLLRTMHDVNRNGELDADEERTLAAALAPGALTGIELCRDGEALEALSLDWRLVTQTGLGEPIELFVLVEFDGGPGLYEVFDSTPAHPHQHKHSDSLRHEGLSVELELGHELWLAQSNHPISADFIGVGPLALEPRTVLLFELVSAGPPPPGSERSAD